MSRLPTIGGDDGNWGTILNDFLSVEHNSNGTHPDSSTSTKGFVQVATQSEVNIGSNTSKVITPQTAQAKLYSTQTLTDASTINWDLSLGAFAQITLGSDRTLANPTNLINGASYILVVKQDGSGNHTLSFSSSYKFPDGFDPVISTGANAVDIIAFLSDGTSLYGSFQQNFS